MEVASLGPLRCTSILWQPRARAWALTVIAKATYTLVPGESPLAVEQEYPNEDDNHWNDDPERSLYSSSDLVPHKARADVLLVGHAFSPGGEPAQSLVAHVSIGDLDKSIEVIGDRTWGPDGRPRDPKRFVRMPLRWERAAGGPDTNNPVGVRLDGRAADDAPLPNLLPLGSRLSSASDRVDPIGFGPLAPTWPTRRAHLGASAASWSAATWQRNVMPDGLDPAFFNAAPEDQQLAELTGRETITLDNLHPQHARLVTRLPGARPRAFVERGAAPSSELSMRADTLWIDTDRGICTLTWRGELALDSPRLGGRVLVAFEEAGQRLSAADVAALAPRRRTEGTVTVGVSAVDDPEHTNTTNDEAVMTHTGIAPFAGPMLPFAGAPPPPPSSANATAGREAIDLGDNAPSWLRRLPFATGSVAAEAPRPPPLPAPPPPPPPAAAPAVAAAVVDSPWAAGARADGSASAIVASPAAAQQAIASPSVPAVPTATGQTAAVSGAVAASNAAAAAAAWTTPPVDPAPRSVTAERPSRAAPPREVVELLWFDPEAVPKIREAPRLKDIVHSPEPEPPGDLDFDAPPPPEIPQETKDRRAVFAALTKGPLTDSEGVQEAIVESITDDGSFVPPIVVMSGELLFPFDELETLKATVTAVSPMASGDKKLEETVKTVTELLGTPWLTGAGGASVAEGLTTRVKEAFAGVGRMLSPSYLETHTERILLEQRHFQRRTVFGDVHLRALFSAGGTAPPMPAYLPDALAKKLPSFQRLRVRVVAEAQVQQDQYETHPSALKVVAIGRLIRPARIRS